MPEEPSERQTSAGTLNESQSIYDEGEITDEEDKLDDEIMATEDELIELFQASIPGESSEGLALMALGEYPPAIKETSNTCLIHKGPVGDYEGIECRACGAVYCDKCYDAIVRLENKCWSCKTQLDDSIPTDEKLDELGDKTPQGDIRVAGNSDGDPGVHKGGDPKIISKKESEPQIVTNEINKP